MRFQSLVVNPSTLGPPQHNKLQKLELEWEWVAKEPEYYEIWGLFYKVVGYTTYRVDSPKGILWKFIKASKKWQPRNQF